MNEVQNCYEILQVPQNASSEHIGKAFKRMALVHHPDKGGDPELFRAMSFARDVLVDANKRLSLDCALEQQAIKKAKQDDQAFEAMTKQSGTSAASAAAGSASPTPPEKKNLMQQQIRIYAVEKKKETACKKNEHEATSGWCLVGQVRVLGSGLLKLNGFVFWVVEFG